MATIIIEIKPLYLRVLPKRDAIEKELLHHHHPFWEGVGMTIYWHVADGRQGHVGGAIARRQRRPLRQAN